MDREPVCFKHIRSEDKMNKAVLLIVFNRLEEAQRTFEQIAIAKPPRLYLSSDGPRAEKEGEAELVQELRTWLLKNITWHCDVKTRFLEQNSGGCRYGVSGAIDWFFETEEDGIILEDDLIASQSFFSFCEELLEYYKDDKDVWVISGYNHLEFKEKKESYYFTNIIECWGWATWKNRWQNYHQGLKVFDESSLKHTSPRTVVQKYWKNILKQMQEEKIDSWAYQWALLVFANKALCINPTRNLISNIGYTGVHYEQCFDDILLGTKVYQILKIIHPKNKKIQASIKNRAYLEIFNIKKIKIRDILKFMKRKPLFLFRKDFWLLLEDYISDKK